MYIGVDIVQDMISRNNARFGNANTRFLDLDITNDIVLTVDLILCRQCLFHLSFSEIRAALLNFKASMSMYLLTTHHPNTKENVDVVTGSCRALNWTRPPFNFPDPLASIGEDYSGQCLALWRLDDIKPELLGQLADTSTPSRD